MIKVRWYHPSRRLTVMFMLLVIAAILATSAYVGGAYLVSQGDQTEEVIRIKLYTMPASILDVDEAAPWWESAWMVGSILYRDARVWLLLGTVNEWNESESIEITLTDLKLQYKDPRTLQVLKTVINGPQSYARVSELIEVNTTEGFFVKLRYVIPGHQVYYTPGAGHYDIVVNFDEKKVISIEKTTEDAPLTWP